MAINRQKITLGISACLLGQEVRFDRSHKKSSFCVNELGKARSVQELLPRSRHWFTRTSTNYSPDPNRRQ